MGLSIKFTGAPDGDDGPFDLASAGAWSAFHRDNSNVADVDRLGRTGTHPNTRVLSRAIRGTTGAVSDRLRELVGIGDRGESATVFNEDDDEDEPTANRLTANITDQYGNDGHWVTIEGEHVFISGGKITKGPANLVGHTPKSLPARSKLSKKVGRTEGSYHAAKRNGRASGRHGRGRRGDASGSGRVGGKTPVGGGPVAKAAGRSDVQADGQKRDGPRGPVGDEPARPVPADIGRVNEKIDRITKLLHAKGQHDAAGWMGKLKDHVNEVGVEHALAALGDHGVKSSGKDKGVQYQGRFDAGDFTESYLNRVGIHSLPVGSDQSDATKKFISADAQSVAGVVRRGKGDFTPRDPKSKNKLEEAKSLPGLEKSKALPGGTTHLTPKLMDGFDKTYGKGKWIVKAYGDEAAAGYGIFFPQRAEKIQSDAKATLHSADVELGKYGFHLDRDNKGVVDGIKHANGDVYKFGSDADGKPTAAKYTKTIDGDARHWGDLAAKAASDERGATLPDGGKDFMVQPAFNVVGVSEKERSEGKTIAPGESRVHITTKGGKVSVVPHSTWVKGDHMPVVFENDETRAIAKAAHEAISALPAKDRNGQIYAPDVLKTDKGYKVVEANPSNHTGGSGYLTDNPMVIDSYVSHLTGQEPAHVSFIKNLLKGRTRAKA